LPLCFTVCRHVALTAAGGLLMVHLARGRVQLGRAAGTSHLVQQIQERPALAACDPGAARTCDALQKLTPQLLDGYQTLRRCETIARLFFTTAIAGDIMDSLAAKVPALASCCNGQRRR
jgi:hypothetical protein